MIKEPTLDKYVSMIEKIASQMGANTTAESDFKPSIREILDLMVREVTDLKDYLVVVKQSNAKEYLSEIDSSKAYFIDGHVNLTGLDVSINVPTSGVSLIGYGFNRSKLICSDDNYELLQSSGSGDIFIRNMSIDVSGDNSQVFAATANTGSETVELIEMNFENCSSLGYLDGFRQGLEQTTGRFGGTPSLEFRGEWLGGYRVGTSIARNLEIGSYSLFKSAVGQTFNSRVGGNFNFDLPSGVSVFEITEANIIPDAALEIDSSFFTGDGVVLNGIEPSNRKVNITKSKGVEETRVGAYWTISTQQQTVISSPDTYVKLAGTIDYKTLNWYNSGGGNNTLTVGTTENTKPLAMFTGSFEGGANSKFTLAIRRYNKATDDYTTLSATSFTTNGGPSGDRAESVSLMTPHFDIKEFDRIEVWVRCDGGTSNVTGLIDSQLLVE